VSADPLRQDRSRDEGRLTSFDHECLGTVVLNLVTQAVVTVDPEGKPLFQNAAADEILTRQDGLSLKAGKLTAARARDSKRLSALFSEFGAVGSDEHPAGKWLKVERRNGLPYAVYVAPLQCNAIPVRGPDKSGVVLVLILDLGRKLNIRADVLQELFGLTPAEARLACALLGGHGIDTAAKLLNVSSNTARTQIRSIFAKLNLTRQQQLIRVLATLTTLEPSNS
jgi:DNA-binding CsgD family transcriptional regulator